MKVQGRDEGGCVYGLDDDYVWTTGSENQYGLDNITFSIQRESPG